MTPDTEAWISQVRRAADALKVVLSSNGRIQEVERVRLASDVEQTFKQARRLVEG